MYIRLKNWFRFAIILIGMTVIFALLMDKLVMPIYVRLKQEVPLINVCQMVIDDARKNLEAAGFITEIVDEVENLGLPPGTVMDQQPPAGSMVKPGRVVRLIITSGARYFAMPNLIGKFLKAAQIELDQLRLRVDSLDYQYSSQLPAGVIISQSIEPGFMTIANSTVNLIVSKGKPPRQLEVPDLSGLGLDEARREIKKAGFLQGELREVINQELAARTVVNQKPEPGLRFDNPVRIDLEITVLP